MPRAKGFVAGRAISPRFFLLYGVYILIDVRDEALCAWIFRKRVTISAFQMSMMYVMSGAGAR